MEIRELKSIIEALLFTWGDPLDISDMERILEIEKKKLTELLNEMIGEFDYNRRGIKIIKIEDSYQLGTRPEHFDWIKKLTNKKPERNLSNAALETLSIIAYRQPVIKSDIEAIRGVKCDRVIETLFDRDLIVELGRMDKIGRPILYGTTEVFLRSFGLESLDDLPNLKDNIENVDGLEK